MNTIKVGGMLTLCAREFDAQVDIDAENGFIKVYNNGKGLPIQVSSLRVDPSSIPACDTCTRYTRSIMFMYPS